MRSVIVVGGGATGFFVAINIKEKCLDLEVIILEKTKKVLQKVKVSSGGRCNVTNGRSQAGELIKFYSRGGKKLNQLLESFGLQKCKIGLGGMVFQHQRRRIFVFSQVPILHRLFLIVL